MSQNILKTQSPTGPVEVILGWDRPLQECFCTVMPLSEEDPGDYSSFLFNPNMADANGVADELKAAGILVPSTMLDALRQDQFSNAGNLLREFALDGQLLRQVSF